MKNINNGEYRHLLELGLEHTELRVKPINNVLYLHIWKGNDKKYYLNLDHVYDVESGTRRLEFEFTTELWIEISKELYNYYYEKLGYC